MTNERHFCRVLFAIYSRAFNYRLREKLKSAQGEDGAPGDAKLGRSGHLPYAVQLITRRDLVESTLKDLPRGSEQLMDEITVY